MSSVISADLKDIVAKYAALGVDKFSRNLILSALNKLIFINDGKFKGISPEIEYLDLYNKLITLYRRENKEEYLIIASIYRKIAHKVYRVMLKKQMTEYNVLFLNMVESS